MLHLLTILATSAGDEAEPSKVAFDICGGLLAIWAVVVTGLGMSNGDFPATAVAKRGVMAVSVVLVAAAMAAAVITA
jgi:hypothetical protein